MKVKFKKLTKTAIVPKKSTEGSIGFDLFADETVKIRAGQRNRIKTGVSITVPKGYYGRIAPKSGLANNLGLDVLAGVIDSDYTGEIIVTLFNNNFNHQNNHIVRGENEYTIEKGYKIAQLIFERAENDIEWEEVKALEKTVRGNKGFGSTGLK